MFSNFQVSKKIFVNSIVVFIATSMLVSCKPKKLDINEQYKDIPVIYCLLNAAADTQFIKINKVFLGDGNAYDYAQEPDSINYNPADLIVTLEEFKLNLSNTTYDSKSKIILKHLVKSVQNDNGVFTKKNNILWYTDTKINSDYAKYKLTIQNIKTGKNDVWAETKIVQSGKDEAGKDLFKIALSGVSGNSMIFYDTDAKRKTVTVRFLAGNDANGYSMTMRINYIEYPENSIKDSVQKSIDYDFEYLKSDQKDIFFRIDGGKLLSFLRGKESTDFAENLNRKLRTAYFTLYAASPIFTQYSEVNAPRAGYLLDKPIYTNINNGYGLFASRFSAKSGTYKFDVSTLKVLRDSVKANIVP